jgi:hypothetical protein
MAGGDVTAHTPGFPVDLAALPPAMVVPGIARWLGVDTDTPPPVDTDSLAAICRLTRRITDLQQQVAAARERNFELRTAADFADTEAAGYIDRNFLERP